jgi:transcriptional antiterminator NusG
MDATTGAGPEVWYALRVTTGQEEKTKKIIESTLDTPITCLIPRRQLKERKNGQWQQVHRILFPGYLIFKSHMTPQLYYQLQQVPLMAMLLKDDDGPLPIHEAELTALNQLMDPATGLITISKAIREDDRIHITQGPLAGMEGRIKTIDHRKGRATVILPFLGEERTIQLGIHIIDKI